jgi:hypothetical protein
VGDEEVGQIELRSQVRKQVEDLRLDGDVQGRHRLVADDELGTESKGAGDADALSLAARELVRVAPRVVAPQAHGFEVVAYALVANRSLPPAVGLVSLRKQPLADDVADRHARVERAVRVLEDDLHAAAHLLQGVSVQGQDVLAVHRDGPTGRLLETEDRPPERGLAAT